MRIIKYYLKIIIYKKTMPTYQFSVFICKVMVFMSVYMYIYYIYIYAMDGGG